MSKEYLDVEDVQRQKNISLKNLTLPAEQIIAGAGMAQNKKGDYFRLEQTKEDLRFNDAEGEERDTERTEKNCMDELSIQRLG